MNKFTLNIKCIVLHVILPPKYIIYNVMFIYIVLRAHLKNKEILLINYENTRFIQKLFNISILL